MARLECTSRPRFVIFKSIDSLDLPTHGIEVFVLQMSKAMGQMTVQRLLEMQEQGINISDVTSDELRATLYTKEVGHQTHSRLIQDSTVCGGADSEVACRAKQCVS